MNALLETSFVSFSVVTNCSALFTFPLFSPLNKKPLSVYSLKLQALKHVLELFTEDLNKETKTFKSFH